MSIKTRFMHYMKWIRVMLSVVFEEFELVCTVLLFFSCHYQPPGSPSECIKGEA